MYRSAQAQKDDVQISRSTWENSNVA
jgi:hypothetical protein